MPREIQEQARFQFQPWDKPLNLAYEGPISPQRSCFGGCGFSARGHARLLRRGEQRGSLRLRLEKLHKQIVFRRLPRPLHVQEAPHQP